MKDKYMSLGPNSTLSDSEKTKIKNFINEGLRVYLEVEDLKGGLSDLGKALAEELGIKPTILMRALSAAHKSSMEDQKEALDMVEEILIAAGRA